MGNAVEDIVSFLVKANFLFANHASIAVSSGAIAVPPIGLCRTSPNADTTYCIWVLYCHDAGPNGCRQDRAARYQNDGAASKTKPEHNFLVRVTFGCHWLGQCSSSHNQVHWQSQWHTLNRKTKG